MPQHDAELQARREKLEAEVKRLGEQLLNAPILCKEHLPELERLSRLYDRRKEQLNSVLNVLVS